MFEKASRIKLRYSTNRGVLSVEDLWDLSLEQLDPIAINLNKRLKESQTESFIKIRTKDTTELELKFNIVKHIIDVKLQEQEERIVAAEKKAKRQKILDLMAKKQDAELESKSYEELAKELEALSRVMNSERELEKWQKVNSAETKEQLFEAVDFICADEPNGLIGTTGKLFTADKLKRSINAAITRRFNANVVTRRYGLRQQVLYLMYYGIE
jgi:hypothetical protein